MGFTLVTLRALFLRYNGGLSWLPEPQRWCRHLFLDHLHCHGGRDCVLPDGIDECWLSLEDLNERWCPGDLGGGMFWRLMIGTVAMLAFGYAGESRTMDPVAGFAAGMAGWFYILYEIFSGEAGKLAGSDRVN